MENSKKLYVVDTNLVLESQQWYENLRDGIIVFPITTIAEIDKYKSNPDSLGLNARATSRLIGKVADKIKYTDVVELEEGRFTINIPKIFEMDSHIFNESINDDLITSVAINLKRLYPEKEVILVSNDNNVRSKILCLYKTYGVDSISLKSDCKFSRIKDIYNVYEYEVDDETVSKLYEGRLLVGEFDSELKPNTSITLISKTNKVMGRVDKNGENIIYIDKNKVMASLKSNFKPLNEQQIHLVDLIKNSGCKIINVNGVIGSGKSFGVINSIMDELNKGVYNNMIIVKPNQPLGKSVGMLPDSWEAKTAPIKASFRSTFTDLGYDLDRLEESGKVRFTTGEYERGMSYKNTVLFIDETQNLESLGVLKALIGRCDENSLVIMASDSRQVDLSKNNESNNPASICMQKLMGQPFYACIHLNISVRANHLNIVDELL